MNRPEICVPIVAPLRDTIVRTATEIAKESVEMAEWRVDFFAGYEKEIPDIIIELKKVLKGKKLIVTLRTVHEGGEPNGSRFSYFSFVRQVLAQGVADYVDVEIKRDEKELLEIAKECKESFTGIIGSYHDFQKTPPKEDIKTVLLKAKACGCDVGKCACMPQCEADVDTLLTATAIAKEQEPDFPIITMSMGELGIDSRLYGGLYGSFVSFGSMGQISAPGQVPVEEMRKIFDCIYSGKKHIVLIGFMGTGKSSVSAALSKMSGWQEIDTDEWIEKKEKRAINCIFEESGEAYFRKKETELIDELATLEPSIISCGGGMALKEINVRKLKAVGVVVRLTAQPETVYNRVKNTTNRPLLKNNMSVSAIEELMQKREPFYERAAEISVITDNRDVASIAKEILEKSTQVL